MDESNGGPRFLETSRRKPAQIYFVVVVIGSTMNFPKVRIVEVWSGDDQKQVMLFVSSIVSRV